MKTDEIQAIKDRIRKERSDRGKQNRANGYAFEYKVMKHEQESSIHVSHAQGSRTVFDIVATKENEVHYIICKKNKYLTPAERAEIEQVLNKMPSFAVVKLAYYQTTKDWVYEVIKASAK
jgi:hypothetical protein